MSLKNQKKDYFWNIIAGFVNASEAVLMSMAVTRYGRLADAGILSIAFAIGNVLMTIGKFGGRIYQVTDIKRQYTFQMYFIQRVITVFLMLITLAVSIFLKGYSGEKRIAIIYIVLIYAIESIEDCYWGYYQSINKLFIGARMFCLRWIVIIVSFIIMIIRTNNMILSLRISLMACIFTFLICLTGMKISKEGFFKYNLKELINEHRLSNWLPGLFRQTCPLFFAGFCSIVLTNLPKFAIDKFMTNEEQACYGFVAMPVFVIGLLNQFIYQPTIVHLTNAYYDGSRRLFQRYVRNQLWVAFGIMITCLLGAATIGIPILSIIYHTDLENYWRELVMLQVAGGLLAISGYLTVVLTLMRKQKVILLGYIISLVIGVIILNISVRIGGTVGASLGYTIVMAILCMFYFCFYNRTILLENRSFFNDELNENHD